MGVAGPWERPPWTFLTRTLSLSSGLDLQILTETLSASLKPGSDSKTRIKFNTTIDLMRA